MDIFRDFIGNKKLFFSAIGGPVGHDCPPAHIKALIDHYEETGEWRLNEYVEIIQLVGSMDSGDTPFYPPKIYSEYTKCLKVLSNIDGLFRDDLTNKISKWIRRGHDNYHMDYLVEDPHFKSEMSRLLEKIDGQ